ncbi:MAG: thiamine pyrophosphate-dependent enzyme, partial [Rhodoplanes sp.]
MQEQDDKLRRRSTVARILADRGDILVVTGLGSTTYDCAAAGDHALNFYLWGAMGSAVMVGFGLAMAQPKRRVLVITGDGELLMG